MKNEVLRIIMRAKTRFTDEEKLNEGRMIHGLISNANYKQKEIAEQVGYDPTTVSQWWNPEKPTRIPDNTFVLLAELLDFDPFTYRPWLKQTYISLKKLAQRKSSSDEQASRNFSITKSVASNIKSLMKETSECSTQIKLADKSGLAQSTIARALSGEVDSGIETLERIAAALGVSIGALLTAHNPNNPQRCKGLNKEFIPAKTFKDILDSSEHRAVDVARATGDTPQAVNNWLSRDKVPDNKVFDVAKFLGIEPSELSSSFTSTHGALNEKFATSTQLLEALKEAKVFETMTGVQLLKVAGMFEAAAISKLK